MLPAAKIDAALSLFLHTAYYAKNFIHNYMDKVQKKNVGKERRKHSTQRYSPTTTAKLADTTSVNEMPTNASAYCMEMLPRQSANPPPIANATDGPLSCIVITTALSSNRGTTATLPIFFFFFFF
jgi:hypothetical protein